MTICSLRKRHSSHKFLVFASLAVTLLTPLAEARAAKMIPGLRRFVVDHSQSTPLGTLEDADGGKLRADLVTDKKKSKVSLGKNEDLMIIVSHINPVWYAYKWKEFVFTRNSGYDAVGAFAKSLLDASRGLKASGFMVNTVDPSASPQLDLAADIETLAGYGTQISEQANACKPIDSPESYRNAMDRVKLTVNAWDIVRQKKELEEIFDKLPTLKINALRELTKNGASVTPAQQSGLNALFLLSELEADVRALIASVSTFKATCDSLNSEIIVARTSYSDSLNQTGTLTIARVRKLDGTGDTQRIGEFEIEVAPNRSVEWRGSVVSVYSTAPVKGVKLTPNGEQFTISLKQDHDQQVGIQTGAALGIYPEFLSPIGGAFQLGVVSLSEDPALLIGGSIHIFKIFSGEAGVALQSYKKLTEGKVGDTLNSSEDLKTRMSLQTGFYIGGSLGF